MNSPWNVSFFYCCQLQFKQVKNIKRKNPPESRHSTFKRFSFGRHILCLLYFYSFWSCLCLHQMLAKRWLRENERKKDFSTKAQQEIAVPEHLVNGFRCDFRVPFHCLVVCVFSFVKFCRYFFIIEWHVWLLWQPKWRLLWPSCRFCRLLAPIVCML